VRHPRTGRSLALVLSLLAVLALAACGTSDDRSEGATTTTAAKGAGEPIVIGVDLPLSGPSAGAAERMKKAFELLAAEINANDGVNGSEIVLDIQDDGGDPTTGVALIDRFNQAGAVAIIGTYNTPVVLAQSDAILAAKIPQLAFAIGSSIGEKQNPWVFQTGPTDKGQIDGLIEYFKANKITKPAILTDTSAFGTGAKPVLEAAFAEAGITPALNDTFAVDATDVSPVLLKAKQSGADAVVVWTVGPPYAVFATGAQQVDLGIPIFGTASAADPNVAKLAGAAANNIFFQNSIDPQKPAVVEVSNAWADEFDGTVPAEAFSAHDILTIIVDGLKKVGNDREALRDYLDTYTSTSLLAGRQGGTFEFTPTNHVGLGGGNTVWNKYVNGEFTVITVK